MDKIELTQMFVDHATKMADSHFRYLEDPNFGRLLKINGPLYSIFYPICKRFEVPDLCEMYRHINYCIRDDGDMSLVHCQFKQEHPCPDIIPGYRSLNKIFVVDGHHSELNPMRILNTAAEHHSLYKRYLVSYSACHMKDATFSCILDWVDSMHLESQLMDKIRMNSSDWNELDLGRQFRIKEAGVNKILTDHIKTSEYKTKKTFTPFEISNLDKFKD